MVSTGLHNVGEEWKQKNAWRRDLLGTRDTSAEVLLYLDNTDIDGDGTNEGDQLSDANDVGDITTEPTDGNYTRKTLSLDSTDLTFSLSSGDVQLSGTVTFDVTNTTGWIDAYGLVLSFKSDVVNSETGQNPHLIATASVSAKDLSQIDEVDVNVNITLN